MLILDSGYLFAYAAYRSTLVDSQPIMIYYPTIPSMSTTQRRNCLCRRNHKLSTDTKGCIILHTINLTFNMTIGF